MHFYVIHHIHKLKNLWKLKPIGHLGHDIKPTLHIDLKKKIELNAHRAIELKTA